MVQLENLVDKKFGELGKKNTLPIIILVNEQSHG